MPNGSLLLGDGHRFVSVTERSTMTTVAGIYETFDGSSWQRLDVAGLDYLDALVGTSWYSVDATIDETGLAFVVPADGGAVDVRAWAVTVP